MKKVLQAAKLLENIRSNGHLAANMNPLEKNNQGEQLFNLEKYGLNEDDLRALPVEVVWEDAPEGIKTAADAVQRLKDVYTSTLAYEFAHVDHTERAWLTQMVETDALYRSLSKEERARLLKRLTEVEGFEQFLHKTFVGQKRFSIEGVDMLVPMLDEVIREGAGDGVRNIMIGMAHRGRLSVLAHVLEKPYSNMFAEFLHVSAKHSSPDSVIETSMAGQGM
jgi:2-oxoglutarate dehydrogenase E1 component